MTYFYLLMSLFSGVVVFAMPRKRFWLVVPMAWPALPLLPVWGLPCGLAAFLLVGGAGMFLVGAAIGVIWRTM